MNKVVVFSIAQNAGVGVVSMKQGISKRAVCIWLRFVVPVGKKAETKKHQYEKYCPVIHSYFDKVLMILTTSQS